MSGKFMMNGIEYLGGGSGELAHHYSTTEQVIGTWIDGKPLYEKTVDFGALPNTTTKQVNHNISNIDYIVDYKAVCRNSAKTSFVPIPRVNANSSLIFDIVFTNTYIEVQVGTDRTGYSMYVTLQYTKTTD